MICVYTKIIDGVWFGVAYEGEQIFATTFGSSSKEKTVQGLLNSLPSNIASHHSEATSVFAERAVAFLKDMYDGKEVSNNFSLAMNHLSSYFQRVIKITSLIPLGYASSYGAVAKVAGGKPRAVGRVMALNPFAPIVPCHRVVGSDFSLTGYGGGLDVKLAFLKREKRGYASKREISVHGKKLQVFPVEYVLNKVKERKAN
ncbi:MGMT family protein [Candidatus Bathyarchaeota archaeon]|nr:MGMT family protein [Candidatus Bathyarchaeota archaeon]